MLCCPYIRLRGWGKKYYVYQRADILSAPYPRFRFSFRILASTNLKLTLYNFRVALHQKVAFNVMPARARMLPPFPFLVMFSRIIPDLSEREEARVSERRGNGRRKRLVMQINL